MSLNIYENGILKPITGPIESSSTTNYHSIVLQNLIFASNLGYYTCDITNFQATNNLKKIKSIYVEVSSGVNGSPINFNYNPDNDTLTLISLVSSDSALVRLAVFD